LTNSLEISSKLVEEGYCFLNEWDPDVETAAISDRVGATITPWPGGLIQTLQPRTEAAPNTYSGNFGLGSFPMHTDLAHWKSPPRYLLLRCLKGYQDVPTLLLDGRDMIASVSRNLLSRAIFKPRRPRDGKLTLVRLLDQSGDREVLRWDEIFLQPASRVGERVDVQVRGWLSTATPFRLALFRPGDTLIVDNWRMLHARSPIPTDREDRAIQRVYLESIH